MKRMLMMTLTFICIVGCMGCEKENNKEHVTGEVAPSIVLGDWHYYTSMQPVNNLPEDYVYTGKLSKDEANDTGLEGCNYYINLYFDSIPDIYVYQQCGTPIDENTIDSTKLQWAYVQYIHTYEE